MEFCFFVSYKAQTMELSKFLGMDYFHFWFYFQDRYIFFIKFVQWYGFLGKGLAYTRESKRDMEQVATADRKRKEPEVACLACLTLANKKSNDNNIFNKVMIWLEK